VNLLAALTHGGGTPLNTVHFWSLSIEEQFYLIWPLVVWACTPRALLRVVAVAVIGGLAVRLGLLLQGSAGPVAIYFMTPLRLDGLMTGAALAVVARRPGGLAPLKPLAPQVLGAGVLALSAVAMWRGGLEPRDPVVAVVGYPVIALAFGALLVMALTAPPTSRLVRTLCSTSLGKWGKYSYGIYLMHYPLLGAIAWKTRFFRHEVPFLGGSRLPSVLLVAALVMATTYTLAWLSYHLYEKRFLELKRYFAHQSNSASCRAPHEGATATAPLPVSRPTPAAS
jgi:peptidoglycan/LPS O-acetylase OafA/YrhL